MTPVRVATKDEIPPGARKIVTVGDRRIGVFNLGGQLVALRDQCPHQGAPLCRGTLGGTTLPCSPGEHVWGWDGVVLRCPWHGWEFDLRTGEAIFDAKVRVKTYPVQISGDAVMVLL